MVGKLAEVAARREEQREALVLAAEGRIAADGLQALKTRDLAQEIGIPLGAIYNLVADLDEVVVRVAVRTMANLDDTLAAADQGSEPVARLTAIALAYRRFAESNRNLWKALFDFRMREGEAFAETILTNQARLFRHIHGPLASLCPSMPGAEREALAVTLFSAAHGVVMLGLEEKLAGGPKKLLDQQLKMLVATICRGLVAANREG